MYSKFVEWDNLTWFKPEVFEDTLSMDYLILYWVMYFFDFWIESLNENIIDSESVSVVDSSVDRQRHGVTEKNRYLQHVGTRRGLSKTWMRPKTSDGLRT